MEIKKVGVLGCGVMGGQIAAHLSQLLSVFARELTESSKLQPKAQQKPQELKTQQII